MSSTFLRTATSFLFIAGLVAACSDPAPSTIASAGGSSSGAGGTSGAVSSSGASGHPSDSSSSSSSGVVSGAIDLDSIITITASEDTCGKVAGTCLDAQSFTIDFLKSTVTNSTCVEVAGAGDAGTNTTQDATTSHALSKDQVDAVKARLAALKTSGTPVTGFDGPIWVLEVSTKSSGTVLYSPNAGCGPQDKMTKIEVGWDDLWDTLRGL